MDIRTDRQTREATTVHNPHSTAQIAGHPLHPMLIPFVIAAFVFTLVVDIIFFIDGNTEWVMASEWLLAAGLIMAGFAALTGLTDLAGDRQIRNLSAAWWHMGGNIIVVIIQLVNFFMRLGAGAAAGIGSTGIILSAVSVAILLFTGWKGWQMVYKHRVGVADY